MHRRVRRALFRLADLLEEGGEHLATAIRRRAERKRRPRPLCFPDPVWVGLMEMINDGARKMAVQHMRELLFNGEGLKWISFDEGREIGEAITNRRIPPTNYLRPEERGKAAKGST